jgi:ABC-type multidrug transport system fused ATPase/permease subunit
MSSPALHYSGTRSLIARLWSHLEHRRHTQFAWILGLTLLSAFAEIASLGAVIPFLAVLTAPDLLFRQPIIAHWANSFGIDRASDLLTPFTIAFAVIVLVSASVRMLLLRVTARFAFATGADLSGEVYRRTLYQPYKVHVARNSSEVISGITQKVSSTVLSVIYPMMTLISSGVTLIATLVTLLVIDPVLAVSAGFGFGISYGVITWFSRRHLHENSRLIATSYTQEIKALQEGLGGIRDVLLDGSQPVYFEIYRRADRALRRAQGNNVFIAQSPRFSMEAVGLILIAGLAFLLSRSSRGITAALPVLGALALGAQRLLPAMQQAYNAWATIAGSHASFQDTINLLDQPMPPQSTWARTAALPFNEQISFNQVFFRYAAQGPWIIDNLNLIIPKGARVGLVGATGSGKSTVLDLLMGLLQPDAGAISIDGRALDAGTVRAWQACIAHVPQNIFLADASLAQNIAFGVPPEEIDLQRVRMAAERAQVAEFVDAMPEGFNSTVGERGVRLSGGQRQRIGIARALYKQASVLVLDEATSALDNTTERSVMDAIEGLSRDLTIVLIAHRLSTVRRCDTIIEIDGGRVVAQAPYDQLIESSQSFNRMASAGKLNP